MKRQFIFLTFFSIILLSSCLLKDASTPNNNLNISFLSTFRWHLISITNTSKSIPTYKGTTADSLRFTWKWAYNGNVLPDSIFYYVNGGVYKFAGISYSYGPSVKGNDIDTVQCYPNWKSGYSKSLVIKSVADNLLVFTVADTANNEIETDSLHR